MAFPLTSAPAETQFTGTPTNHNVNLPATVDAGDLLLVGILVDAGGGTLNTPSGWTLIAGPTQTGGTGNGYFAVYAKVADGSEDGGTVNVVSSSGGNGAAQCYRITSWYGAIGGVEGTAGASGASTNPNPPAHTASWGSADNLWFAFWGAEDDDETASSAPTNYGNLVSTVSGGGLNNGGEVGSARRELASASDNPGAFTISGSESWAAATVVVRPSVAVDQTVAPAGVSGSGGIGAAGTAYDFSQAVTGVLSTGAMGSLQVNLSPTVLVADVSASGNIGTFAFEFAYQVNGVTASGFIGDLSFAYDFAQPVAGVEASAAAGGVDAFPGILVPLSGVSAAGRIGVPWLGMTTDQSGWGAVFAPAAAWTPASTPSGSWSEAAKPGNAWTPVNLNNTDWS